MQMEEIRQKFPDHYIPYLTIDPTFLTDAEIKTTIEKYHGNLKYPGLKPYFPRNHYPLTGPQYHQWFQYGNDHKLFALIHYDAPTTYNDIDKLAPKYPDLFFLVAHSGCSYTAASRVIQLAKKYKNVYAELTFTSVLSRVVEILCREITADRVLFGADTPMRDPAPQVGWVVYANLTFEEKKKVLGENMRKILMRAGWK
jgi:predicted TIM-barrel fold metal-dependent hydrolase